MSLIMTLETYDGIVMTADRLSTLSVKNEKLNTVDFFPKTYNAHKLFVTKNGYGISCCGNSKLENNYLVEQFIKEEICTQDFSTTEPMKIMETIQEKVNMYNCDASFLLCGYRNEISFRIEIHNNVIEEITCNGIYKNGDISIPNAILDTEKFHYGYQTYRLQDAINLLIYTNQVTAKYQQFQEVLQTVSEECDVLVLLKNGEHIWLNKNDLHI